MRDLEYKLRKNYEICAFQVRRKTLSLAMDLVTSRTVEETVLVLKKEISKTHNTAEHEDTGKYRQLLVRTLHSW